MNWKFWERVDTSGSNLGLAGRLAAGLFVLYLLLCSLIAWWWDDEPDLFSVRESAALHAETHNRRLVTGYITTATLIRLAKHAARKTRRIPLQRCVPARCAGWTTSPTGNSVS